MNNPYKIPLNTLGLGNWVFLRSPGKDDEEEFMDRLKRSRRFLYPWIINKTGVSFYKRYLMRFEQGDFGHFVCTRSDSDIVGVVNINHIEKGEVLKGCLGFYSFVEYARQGYLTEGLKLVLDRAFNTLGFSFLEANIQPANLASKNFVQYHGFKRENFQPLYLKVAGNWINHEKWILRKEEWRPHR
jgi:[ribosomal protein S5]-alanine N-acetyltransferase